jgi:ribosomal protein S18 acetylase RimI-like enzyme
MVGGQVERMTGQDSEQSKETLITRELQANDVKHAKEFILNNHMQGTRLTNGFIYRSIPWLSAYIFLLASAFKKLHPWNTSDWGRFLLLCCALTALSLVAVDYPLYYFYKHKTKELLREDAFLQNPEHAVAKLGFKCWTTLYNENIVAILVIQASAKDKEAVIAHWYVQARYRNNGLGGDLLSEALHHLKQQNLARLTIKTSTVNQNANITLEQFGFERSSLAAENMIFALFSIRQYSWSLDASSWLPCRKDN